MVIGESETPKADTARSQASTEACAKPCEDPTPLWKRARAHLALALFLLNVLCNADRGMVSVSIVEMRRELSWGSSESGAILSGFFWGYLALQAFGGWALMRWGARPVLALSMATVSLCSLATPAAARASVPLLLAVRVTVGLAGGLTLPVAHHMASIWVPAKERSRFIAFCTSGIYAGSLAGLSASLLVAYGWPAAFYLYGLAGLLWTVVWICCFSSTPQAHPWMSASELCYIRASASEPKTVAVPWGKLLFNKPFLAVIAAALAIDWNLYLVGSWLPTYFSEVAHVETASLGLMLMAPYGMSFVASNLGGYLADWFGQSAWRLVSARKLVQSLSTGGIILAFLLFALLGVSTTPMLAVVCSCVGTSSIALSVGGYWRNVADLSNELSGVLLGLANTIASVSGVVANVSTGYILQHGTSGWPVVFVVGILVQGLGHAVYMKWASSDTQFLTPLW